MRSLRQKLRSRKLRNLFLRMALRPPVARNPPWVVAICVAVQKDHPDQTPNDTDAYVRKNFPNYYVTSNKT